LGITENRNTVRAHTPRTLHLHIGIPKTASTWLQNKIFPQLEHLHYLNCPKSNLFVSGDSPQKEKRMMEKIFKSSSQIWQGFGDTIFRDMLGDQSAWLDEGRDLLISEEMIGRQGSRPALLAAHLRKMKLKAFEWGFDRFSIICMIRRQDHWLAYHYAQISDRLQNPGQSDFEKFVQEVASPRKSRYGFGMLLDYNILYDHLIEVSGNDNLLILPYELLKDTPGTFLNLILQNLDTPEDKVKSICTSTTNKKANVRSEQENEVWKLRDTHNRKVKRLLHRWLLQEKNQTIEITPDLKNIIHRAYSIGNQKLAAKTDLALEQYGYIRFE
jgi:hypothetical protein